MPVTVPAIELLIMDIIMAYFPFQEKQQECASYNNM